MRQSLGMDFLLLSLTEFEIQTTRINISNDLALLQNLNSLTSYTLFSIAIIQLLSRAETPKIQREIRELFCVSHDLKWTSGEILLLHLHRFFILLSPEPRFVLFTLNVTSILWITVLNSTSLQKHRFLIVIFSTRTVMLFHKYWWQKSNSELIAHVRRKKVGNYCLLN